jgi:hypothetical protein
MMDLPAVSEGLFGRGMRLPLLMWIRRRDDPLFYITEARKGTGFEHAHVQKELKTLVGLGMLARLPVERKNERQYFRVNSDSILWRFVDVALELEGQLPQGTVVPKSN